MTERSHRALFWVLALSGAVLDQTSKYGVFRWLYNGGQGGQYEVVPGVFEVLTQFTGVAETGTGLLASLRSLGGGDILPKVNHGALFGFLADHVHLANGLFAAISLVAAVAITAWATRPSTARDRGLMIALGLILAGTLGNLYDRVVFNGVRDFLHLHYHDAFDWPVFNVADCCLVCGAILLLLQAFLGKPVPTKDSAARTSQEVAQVR
jgi:lipoprotein signal peptidase